jgi:hypothetical protein
MGNSMMGNSMMGNSMMGNSRMMGNQMNGNMNGNMINNGNGNNANGNFNDGMSNQFGGYGQHNNDSSGFDGNNGNTNNDNSQAMNSDEDDQAIKKRRIQTRKEMIEACFVPLKCKAAYGVQNQTQNDCDEYFSGIKELASTCGTKSRATAEQRGKQLIKNLCDKIETLEGNTSAVDIYGTDLKTSITTTFEDFDNNVGSFTIATLKKLWRLTDTPSRALAAQIYVLTATIDEADFYRADKKDEKK